MKKLFQNSAGFGAIRLLLIVVVIGLLGFVGWYIYTQTTDRTANKQTSTSQDYLEIKEWGVRFKLSADAKGSYYKIRQAEQYAYVDVFNSNFDALKNKKGVQCKDELLFVIARYSENDPRLGDPTNSKPEDYIKEYGYTGTPAHQAPPRCSFVNDNPDANAEYDNTVLDAFTKYQQALTESFESLEAI